MNTSNSSQSHGFSQAPTGFSSAVDVARHMETVARLLLGEPNKHLSSRTELRYGTNGSLSVDATKGTFYDHENGVGGGVLDLIRRKTGLANREAVEWMRDELGIQLDERKAKAKLGPIVQTYDYVDEDGLILFQVTRHEPKDFRQRRPDPTARDGWSWNLNDTRRVLYRLPELRAADPSEPVFVVEGEKDADRLRGLGFIATTCPGGANKWHLVDDTVLADRPVILVPDLDKAGRAHEQKVAGALTGKAASVRVLRLPIPDPGKGRNDVSYWLDRCGGTAEELRRLAAEVPEATVEEARPTILLEGGKRAEILRQIEAALRDPAKVTPGWIFARGLAPAVLRHSVDATKLRAGGVEITLPPRTAYLAAAKPEHMASLLDGRFRFARARRDGEAPCDCPADLARHVLANASLLPLASISRAPVLRADGSVLDRPGYDAQTGIFYAPEIEFPPVPSNPTQADARAALERLSRPFRGFPFATETDRAAAIGEVLTLLTRHLVPRAPAFLHNATEAGSGKTKLFDTISIIALGCNAALLNADILEDETELKKVLTTLTLAAAPLAVFDNVARGGELRSPGMSNYLTATIYGDRLLGTNEEIKAATCTVIGLTGNGCEIAGDNTRRILRVDLDAGVERPEMRAFDFDCETEAREDRGELVAAALTILRAHALAGRPAAEGHVALGSFEDWQKLVCGALVFAGAPDILALLEKTRTVDPERGRLAEVLHVMVGVGATRVSMKAGEIIREAERLLKKREGDEDAKIEAEGWLEVLGRFGKDGSPHPGALSRYLNKNKNRVVDDMTLLAEQDSHTKNTVFRVQVERPKSNPEGRETAPINHKSRDLRWDAVLCGGNSGPFLRDVKTEPPSEAIFNRARAAEIPTACHRIAPQEAPPWTDDRAWVGRIGWAQSRAERVSAVLAWGQAAGCEVQDGDAPSISLRPGLSGMALSELKTQARLNAVKVAGVGCGGVF